MRVTRRRARRRLVEEEGARSMTGKIALVCTSARELRGHATGAWLEEIATPYYAIRDAGLECVIVSIDGGEVPIDAASASGDFFTKDCETFVADAEAQAAMKASASLASVEADAFEGVYLAGGHGTCVDFYKNAALTAFIEAFVASGKPVAADCHGPIALLDVKRADGTPLLAGAKATCFTDSEETAVGLAETVPCLLETEFKKLGAEFSAAADWTPNAVTDGKLVTGQNPASSKACVDAFLALF